MDKDQRKFLSVNRNLIVYIGMVDSCGLACLNLLRPAHEL
jgi:hypothetical protein